ncbi:arginine/serine-rich protein 1-like [Choloepus didactylus]|uniref:arginine/serine-rich protein 1-like n=1 Tax=Choloepus didactylus TaxID=27675 RepID=UPI0018A04B31|nr:arginine/serine-rich protein 1-like [Choloepus didactylus]
MLRLWPCGVPGRTQKLEGDPGLGREKERMELLEIAKASAAKSLGIAYLDLAVCLTTVPVAKESNCGIAVPNTAAKFKCRILPICVSCTQASTLLPPGVTGSITRKLRGSQSRYYSEAPAYPKDGLQKGSINTLRLTVYSN